MMLGAVLTALVVTTSFMIWALRERNRAREATVRAEQEAMRAERFSSLAGTTFLAADEIEEANRRWGAEIQELVASHSPDDPDRVRRECQYVTWLMTHAVLLREPNLLRQSVIDINELRRRAKSVLGLDNSHFLSLAKAHAESAILLEEKKLGEIAGLMEDVVASYGFVRGQDDPTYQHFVLVRTLAVLGSQAGRQLPTAEALRVLTETASHVGGLSIDPAHVTPGRLLETLQQQVDQWQTRNPTWYQSLIGSTKSVRQDTSEPVGNRQPPAKHDPSPSS
jgi:hypothetical protein